MTADGSPMLKQQLEDGRALCVTVELGQWSAWIEGDSNSHVIGFPLEGVLTDVIGLNSAHDDPTSEIVELAKRVRLEMPNQPER